MNPEVGRPLTAADIRAFPEPTVVVLAPPGKDVLVTMWVQATSYGIVFTAAAIPGVRRWHIVTVVRDDGAIIDDQGRVVHVFEYLGDV